LSLAACGGSDSSAPPVAVTPVVPRLDEATCPYTLDASQRLGSTVRCGALIVPQDRRSPQGATIRVPFIVFKGSATAGTPPVFYLTGGPGQDWGDVVQEVKASDSPGFTGGPKLARDEVLIEQRGASLSTPALTCAPEKWGPMMFDKWEAALADVLPRVKKCADGFTAQNIRPEGFTTDELAADVNDLRRLLGYDKIVLNGVSYGTSWALAIVRDFPGSVDRVVLDSVVAQSLLPLKSAPEGTDAAFAAIAAACATQPACAAAYPDLDARVSALLTQLNSAPLPWTLGPGGQFTAAVAIGFLSNLALVEPELYPAAVVIFETLVADGLSLDNLPADAQAELVNGSQEGFDQTASTVVGQYWSIVCADNAPVTVAERVEAVLRARPALQPAAGAAVSTLTATCGAWPYRRDLPAASYAPVVSSVPALILSGGLDPSTPPTWAKQVAQQLTGSTLVSFPQRSHSLQGGNACANALVVQFLAKQPLNPSCAAEPLDFVLPES
jgi:pimeloyl-ACP methyl ester carboxylesterase